jgi:signal transduction histidine kinase/CheY-like chemotaxis protein
MARSWAEDRRETQSGVEWRALIFARMCRGLAALSGPAALLVAITPAPFGLVDRAALLCIPGAIVVVALFAQDPRHTRPLAAFLVGSIVVVCMVLAARSGLGPGVALGLGSALLLVAIFFGARAVWWSTGLTALALLGLAVCSFTGKLRLADPAVVFDWSQMSTWLRVVAGYVAAMSVTASAVAMVITHLEKSVRERDRLLVAERTAIESEKRARLHMAALQRVTAELSRASTFREVVDVACRIGSEALNGDSGIVWMLDDHGALHIAGSWGSTTEYLDHFRVIPAGSNLPAQRVVRSRQPLWVETEEEMRASSRDLHQKARAAGRIMAFGVLPLAVNGVVKGVIAFAQPIGHRFDADDRAYYATLSLHCSQALERAILLETAREAAARAEAANRLKDEFLSTVSHELRTPLTAITGWVHMLRSGSAPADRRDHALAVIERNARAQAKLIGDLLDVSRITAGRLQLNVAPIDPTTFIEMAIDSVKPAAEAKGVRLETRLDGMGSVVGDGGRLQQVVANLLTNAVKFSSKGGQVEVVLTYEPPNVTIAVHDHGEGIRPEFLPHLFEPFRQAEGGFARSHGGLGLGLTITKRLVELHGGTIEAHSDGAGRGATFVVRLPCAGRSRDASSADLTAGREPAIAGERAMSGLNVLLVEDEPDTREVLLALFDACGARVCGTSSAAEALEQFQRARPDILVSDIGLRGEDGLALIRKVRRLPGGGDLPALALTAFVRAEDRDAAVAAGFDAHVQKPIDPAQLLLSMMHLLRDPSVRASAQYPDAFRAQADNRPRTQP